MARGHEWPAPGACPRCGSARCWNTSEGLNRPAPWRCLRCDPPAPGTEVTVYCLDTGRSSGWTRMPVRNVGELLENTAPSTWPVVLAVHELLMVAAVEASGETAGARFAARGALVRRATAFLLRAGRGEYRDGEAWAIAREAWVLRESYVGRPRPAVSASIDPEAERELALTRVERQALEDIALTAPADMAAVIEADRARLDALEARLAERVDGGEPEGRSC